MVHLNKNQRLSRACIVHLVIKRTNWSYVKTMSCSGSHLGITINIKNTNFVKDLPMIDAQFRFNQCNSFREEYISVFSPYGQKKYMCVYCHMSKKYRVGRSALFFFFFFFFFLNYRQNRK